MWTLSVDWMICSLWIILLDIRGIAFWLLLFFVSCVMDVSLFHDVSSSRRFTLLHNTRFFWSQHHTTSHNINKVVVLDFQNSDLIVLFFPFLSFLHFQSCWQGGGRLFGFPFPHFQFRVNNLSGTFCPLRQLHGALSVCRCAAALVACSLAICACLSVYDTLVYAWGVCVVWPCQCMQLRNA